MKTRNFGFVLLFIIVVLASFVQARVESVKNDYSSIEIVYAKSTTIPCNLPEDENVTLYIVVNKDEWFGGESLDDVRDAPQEILNSQFITPKKIWESPKGGFYDIIIDCDGDGFYTFNEPVDSFAPVGFTVTTEKGTGSASRGEKDIGSHIWRYDPENPKFSNEMLQIKLVASDEDIMLENITIRAVGTGDDAEIERLEIYADENNDGKLSAGELIIVDSQPAYEEDNGLVTLPLDYILTRDLAENILIVYEMKQEITEGEFSLIVESIYGLGENSGEIIELSGLPITSGIKTVLPEKTCLGELTLELEPNPAFEDGIVTANLSGLTGCSNKTIVLRLNPCGSSIEEEVGSCVVGEEGAGCGISFSASVSRAYHACVDKNDDEDMVDFGEYAIEDLIVEGKPAVVEGQNITEEVNITGETAEDGEKTTSEITGDVIEELKKDLSEAGSFFILLEITLLLILFVLTMIMFRLKPRKKGEETKEKEEEEDEE